MQKILNQIQDYCKLKNLSENTCICYTRHARQFFEFHSPKKPKKLGKNEIRNYLLYLIKDQKKAVRTIKQAHSALRFLYTVVLEKPLEFISIPQMKKEKKLPVVLSVEEINNLFDVIDNIRHKALLTLIYSAGLRATEAVNLKIKDIDSKRMQIRIENSKGAQDRYSILSEKTLKILREYWKAYKPQDWLFPSFYTDTHITYKAASFLFKKYKKLAGIKKLCNVHCLRHSFATHLLENGADLHHIQLLLGHRSPSSTTVYLHVRRIDLQKISSPFDVI